MRRLTRRPRAAIALATVVVALPAGPVAADPAGPTDYRTEIVSITPATDAIKVSIEGGDAFIRVAVAPGHELLALGYDGEPYLRVTRDGTVERNRRSYATYYNEDRYGEDEIPDVVDSSATPEWERIGDGGAWAWHDHRAHWMGTEPPVGMEPGDELPSQVVPLVVDGAPVDVVVVTRLVGGPSPWPAIVGVLIGLQLVLVAALIGSATATLGVLTLAGAATAVGAAQYWSVPAETGPLVTWWLLPALAALAAVATIVTYGRSLLLHHGLLALAGLLLVVWAFDRRDGLTKPVLPTELPFWLDRLVTAGALVGGAAAGLMMVRRLFAGPATGHAPEAGD